MCRILMTETCGEMMVAGSDHVSANSMCNCCNGKVVDQDQIQNEENSNQLSAAKPPRNISTMRHCSSSAWLSESVLMASITANLVPPLLVQGRKTLFRTLQKLPVSPIKVVYLSLSLIQTPTGKSYSKSSTNHYPMSWASEVYSHIMA